MSIIHEKIALVPERRFQLDSPVYMFLGDHKNTLHETPPTTNAPASGLLRQATCDLG
jgi:hypothetical protein